MCSLPVQYVTSILSSFFVTAVQAGLTNSGAASGAGFPPGANPYVISPQDQQYLAAIAAGQLLQGKL
jgi:hypothetical protein